MKSAPLFVSRAELYENSGPGEPLSSATTARPRTVRQPKNKSRTIPISIHEDWKVPTFSYGGFGIQLLPGKRRQMWLESGSNLETIAEGMASVRIHFEMLKTRLIVYLRPISNGWFRSRRRPESGSPKNNREDTHTRMIISRPISRGPICIYNVSSDTPVQNKNGSAKHGTLMAVRILFAPDADCSSVGFSRPERKSH